MESIIRRLRSAGVLEVLKSVGRGVRGVGRSACWIPKFWLVVCTFAVVYSSDGYVVCPQETPLNPLQRLEDSFPAMGVKFKIVAYAPDRVLFEHCLHQAKKRVSEIEKALSDYDRVSEINRLARTSPHFKPQTISDDLAAMCRLSESWYHKSNGAFDPTIGPLTQRWRMARKRGRPLSDEARKQAMTFVGWEKLTISQPDTLQMTVAGMKLDFGGIAKGYAADEALKIFDGHKINSALIDASGDIRVSGPPPGRSAWRIQIGSADSECDLFLKHAGVATSGDSAQRLRFNGKSYSHIIDPRSGNALENSCTVTVIALDATSADALASAVSVLGHEKGMQLVEDVRGAEARVDCPHQNELSIRASSTGFPVFQKKPADSTHKSSFAPERLIR